MQKIFEPSQIVEGLPGIIILSHGPFAIACVETIKLLAGEQKNIAAFALEEGDDPDGYGVEFMRAVDLFPDGSVILVDIKGGTPGNVLMTNARKKNKLVWALTGVNIPMILHALSERTMCFGRELLESLQNTGGIYSLTAVIEKYIEPCEK